MIERMDHTHSHSAQVMVGNIPENVSAKDLAQYLEARLGVVYRCRLKTFLPPLNANPLFSCNEFEEISCYVGSPCSPHAFVHFATPEVAHEACKRAEEQKLCMRVRKLCPGSEPMQYLRVQLTSDVLDIVNPHSMKTRSWKLSNVGLELGSLISRNDFLVSWKGPFTGTNVEVDAVHKKFLIFISQWTCFQSLDSGEKMWMKCSYKLEFLVRDMWEVRKENEWDGTLTFVVQFRMPPRIYFRTEEDDIYHDTSFDLPDDADLWVRTLDFTPEKSLGRCHAYRISVSPRQTGPFQAILGYFKQQVLLKSEELPKLRLPWEVQSVQHRSHFFLVENHRNTPFEIMFLVNSVVHKGIIKASSLTPGFYNVLDPSVTKISQSIFALNHIYSYKTPIFDAQKRLKQVIDWSCSKEILERVANEDTVEVRRFFVTPTKAYCLPAEVELSNRVLRHYRSVADRFLRVSFLDENLHTMSATMLNAAVSSFARTNREVTRSALYNRVREILLKGFVLCGRHYEFLAFSSNQLRDHSAWFFAKKEGISVWTIRGWMGRFEMPNVAKYAARMGQCFSSTFSTVKFPDVEPLPDIIRNGYNFSDGIGKISPMLALKCATILKLIDKPPSAYQIRYGGFKGVVVTWPTSQPDQCSLALRDSMKKFHSVHDVIEVVNWSRYLPCFLNRQIITLLSALNVPNQVFINLQDSMVEKLDRVLDDAKDAFEVLSSYCSGETYSTVLEMLSAGFHPLEEPHLYSVLHCIRASYLEEVLSKARIYVKDGRWLLGCMDELAVIEYGECFVQVSLPFEEDTFAANLVGSRNIRERLKVITGKVIMAKNPCLHPGDIRILQAVDHPELHHLVDCLVMPQKGERPHSNEASGSDLDGDIYFVCWDPRLIPPGGKSWEPMQYTEHEERRVSKQKPRIEDLVEFFVTHMVNDHLGKICNAHVVHADMSEMGALDPKCLQLATLAAIAVDSPKTGKRVNLPAHLRPKMYPDFMDKQDRRCYRSEKILGYLFRRVKRAAEKEVELSSCLLGSLGTPFEKYYDKDLEMDGFKKYIDEAWKHKMMYDARLTALMDQFDVKAEGEIVSGHLTTFASKSNSRVKGDLNDRLRRLYTHLRDEFKILFEQLAMDTGHEEGNEKTEAEKQIYREKELECKASAWYHVTYNPDIVREMKQADPGKVVLLSFPWIGHEYLCRIKKRKRAEYESYYNLIRSVGVSL